MDSVMRGCAHQCPWLWEISHGNMAKSLILGVRAAPLAILGVPPSEEACSLKFDGIDFVEYIPV